MTDQPDYPDESDEYWRRNAPPRPKRQPSAAAAETVREVLTRDEKLAALGLERTATFDRPERQICRRCGCEVQVLHSVPGEVVRLPSYRDELVGVVRTTCGPCLVKSPALAAAQR